MFISFVALTPVIYLLSAINHLFVFHWKFIHPLECYYNQEEFVLEFIDLAKMEVIDNRLSTSTFHPTDGVASEVNFITFLAFDCFSKEKDV